MGYIGQAPTKVPLTSSDITDGTIALADMAANSVDSDQYVDASVDLAHMSSQSVDEDNLHISNSGSNGQFLSKQSGDAGGLTWAAAGTTDVKFQVHPTSTASNVTGAGTSYKAVYGTEVFDTANAFDGVSTFTAPETGKYIFSATVLFSGVTAASDSFTITLVSSNRSYITAHNHTNLIGPGQIVRFHTVIADMDASDEIYVSINANGESSDVWDFQDSMNNVFYGALLA